VDFVIFYLFVGAFVFGPYQPLWGHRGNADYDKADALEAATLASRAKKK